MAEILSINDLENGIFIIVDREPYVVLDVKHLHMGRGGSNVQTQIKNLRTGQVFNRNFKPSDNFKEAKIEKIKSSFIYENRGVFWFNEIGEAKNRFSLKKEELGEEIVKFLKPDLETTALKFNEKVISIELPVKADYKIIEAPPTIRGDTAQGGNKVVLIETGAKISVPLFINEGDIIKINTQTGQYVERIEKA